MYFESALGSAIGGFFGVIIFFLVRVGIEIKRSKPELIKEYLCAHPQNTGQADEFSGELMHHHGKRISVKNEYIELGANNPIWEWTKEPCGKDAGASVIYGPYSTDCAEPGLYSATFIIRGVGFSKPTEIIDDLILLEIDVNKTIPQYSANDRGVSIIDAQFKITREYIKASDLARGGWQEFELLFYSDAQGVWEYRVTAFDGIDNKPDHTTKFGSNVRILFDKIIIRKINKFKLPWV